MGNEEDVIAALEKAKTRKGIQNYLEIMAMFPNVNVSTDAVFQIKYNCFYRICQRSEDFYKGYYSFMETHRKAAPSFTETLRHLGQYGKLDASFSSKLLATINPNLPVWDKWVLHNTSLEAPSRNSAWEIRVAENNTVYEQLRNWYDAFIPGEEGQRWIQLFDERYPGTNITPVKKIDFILWQLR